MKRLLVFHPAIAPYRIDLFNKLNAAFNAKFYFYRRNITTQKFNQERLLQQLHFKPGYLNFGFPLGYRDRVLRLGILHKILKYRPDIILCSEYSITTIISLFYAKVFLRKSKVYTLCDDSLDIAKDCRGLRKYARMIAVKWIDGIILCNEPTKIWYSKRFPNVNVLTFPIIHDEEKLQLLKPQILTIAKDYKKKYMPYAGKVFLYVGRLSAEKNLPFLLHSFAKHIRATKENTMLCIVGEGPLNEELNSIVIRLGLEKKVLFPGRFEGEELYAWYIAADCFVLPSTYEPFGAVVSEALIFGLPVICSSAAGSSFLINDKNGAIFDPNNENELVELLNRLSIDENMLHSQMPFTFEGEVKRLLDFLKC